MLGEYYTVKQGYFDDYLYVVPSVYVKEDSELRPKSGQTVQMFAQMAGLPRVGSSGVADPDKANDPWYESWSCSVKYLTSTIDRKKSDLVRTKFYEGSNLISAQTGAPESLNSQD